MQLSNLYAFFQLPVSIQFTMKKMRSKNFPLLEKTAKQHKQRQRWRAVRDKDAGQGTLGWFWPTLESSRARPSSRLLSKGLNGGTNATAGTAISDSPSYAKPTKSSRENWHSTSPMTSLTMPSWDFAEYYGCSCIGVVFKAKTDLLSVSASRGPVFRRYLLNGWLDQDQTLAQGVSAYGLVFHNIPL